VYDSAAGVVEDVCVEVREESPGSRRCCFIGDFSGFGAVGSGGVGELGPIDGRSLIMCTEGCSHPFHFPLGIYTAW